jgi:hypothetical protein
VYDLIQIPFSGGEILAVDVNGRPWIVLRPILSRFGLDCDAQIRKVQQQPWATVRFVRAFGVDGRLREMAAADLRTLLMLLATIPASRVSEPARASLVAYQTQVADAVEAHWARPPADGYVYAIHFSSGMVKVGQAADVARRLNQHEKEARNHGVVVTASWRSPLHANWQANEQRLISYCLKRYGGAASGNEYFMGAEFAAVVEFARSLNFPKPQSRTEVRAQAQLDLGLQLPLDMELTAIQLAAGTAVPRGEVTP